MKRTQYKLDNGMDVVLEPMAIAPVVACNVWVRVGSADETPEEAGLAHVHEHMLFKGTERREVGQIARDVEASGGHINAFTSFDQTCYYVVMSSRYFDSGLDILSDAIRRSSFDADELERELEVIQEEIKRGEDNPARVSSRLLFETAFETHPYRLPIIGTSESVASFKRDDVVSFFKKHYVPENMALIVAGDFDVDDAKERIDAYFGDFTGPKYHSVQRPAEREQNQARAATEQREVGQNRLRVGFHIPDVRHQDIPALDVLSIILGYGDASHLYRTIQREAQLVHSVFASAYTPREAGLFVVGADFQLHDDRPETSPDAVLERILEEVYRFRYVVPGTTELDRAKTLLESQEIYSKQTIEGLAMKLGHYLTVAGELEFEEEYYRALREVSPSDIRRVANRYLSEDNTTAVLVQPESEPAVTDKSLLDAVKRASHKSRHDAVDTKITTDDKGIARVKFPGGPTLLVQRDPSVETFSMRALTLGGVRYEDERSAGLHKLTASLMTRGTPSRSALEIAGEVESMAASLKGLSGRNSFGLGLTGLTRFFDQCFDIFADCMLLAQVPEEEFDRERRLQHQRLTARRDKLGAVNYDQFAASFFGPHPYGLCTLGTEDTLAALQPEQARRLLELRRDPTRMVISVVGDVTVDQVANHVERYFSSAEPADAEAPQIPSFTPPRHPSVVIGDLEKEQAHVIAGFPGPLLASDDIYTLDVLYAVLSGQGGRLFYELRDRQSLAYSVYASRIIGLDASAFTVRIATSPEKISRAVDGIRAELNKLRNGDLSDPELERAKRYLIGNHDIGLQRNSSRAMTFGLDELYELGYRQSLEYGDRISEVTSDDVHRFVDKFLVDEQMLVSIVKPPDFDIDVDSIGLKHLE